MMNKLIGSLLIIASMAVLGTFIVKKITLKQEVTGFLKRAGDANTVELANGELKKALTYLEQNNLTEGYTSILYRTPDEDVGFWYQNLKASQQELDKLGNSSSLEKTNVLLKLRETVLDSGKKSSVTVPDGLSVFPHNKRWVIMGWSAFIGFFAGLVLVLPAESFKTKPSGAINHT